MVFGEFRMLRCAMPGVEAVEARTAHVFSKHTHDQFGIGVIFQGAQKSASGRGPVEAGPGDVITVNPGEVHDGAPIGDAGRAWRMIYFDPALVADAAQDVGAARPSSFEFTQPVMHDPATAARLLQLFAALTGPADGSSFRSEELLLFLVDRLMERENAAQESKGLAAKILKAKTSIDDEPATAVTLGDLAGLCGLSRFQLLRGFVAATGLTPHAYLTQKRMDLARRLIVRGTPLADAAAACGFADQSHMTRIFSRKYGVSPGAYAAAFN